MRLLPREHGAYGQLLFPVLTMLAVAGVTLAALLILAAVVAAFLAHEPALVATGMRGPRARREHGMPARRTLALLLLFAAICGGLAAARMPPSTWWTLAVPMLASVPLVLGILARNEKTWPTEIAVAVALSSTAIPIGAAAGASTATILSIATVFAITSVLSTLAVRVAIVRVRGGGNPREAAITRRAVFALVVVLPLLAALASAAGLVSWIVLLAVVPGVLLAIGLASAPPPPTRLRAVGWTLIGMFTVTALTLVVGLGRIGPG